MKLVSAAAGHTAALAMCLQLAALNPAYADHDEVTREGICGNRVSWEIKAKADDGRFEVEVEVDTSRSGQRWSWVLKHNGSLSGSGSSRTLGSSGSFEVERSAVDVSGVDTFRFRINRNATVCVAQVSH